MKKYICGGIIGLLVIVVCGAIRLFPYHIHTPPPEIRYDETGKALIGHKQDYRHIYEEIPSFLTNAVVAIEDKRFWYHPGVDPLAFLRAVWSYLTQQTPRQGASTIDQQLIKLDRQQFTRTWQIKIQENIDALRLQPAYTKRDLLRHYLNMIPFSHGIQGRKAACQSYRGTPCAQISPEQFFVTIATSQLGANPYNTTDRPQIVHKAKLLATTYPDLFVGHTTNFSGLQEELQDFSAPLAPYVQEYLRTTTPAGKIPYNLTLSTQIDTLLKRTKTHMDQYNISDCCVMVLDGAGGLISMNKCTSRDDSKGGKVPSCLLPRQTGSAIKPFLYLYAFKKLNKQSQDTVVDEPVHYDLGDGNLYDPKNFDLTYHGEVTYAYALGNSLNVPAVKTVHEVGVGPFLAFIQDNLKRYAPRRPVNPKTADDVGLSVALGTYELSVAQFTHLRRAFLPQHAPTGYEEQRREIVDILNDPTNKIVSFGQDNFLSRPGRAVKTGTSRNFVDGRICGVTTGPNQRAVCLRFGNQMNQPMGGASSEAGSYLWSLIIDAIEQS